MGKVRLHSFALQIGKTSKVEKFRSTVRGLIAAVRVNAEFVLKHRAKLDCSPAQSASLESFLNLPADSAKVTA